ncbi:MAG: glycosyltransferase family 25 protein, partial [Candidatus Saccharimonadales bacterium]
MLLGHYPADPAVAARRRIRANARRFESGVFCISLERHSDRWRSLAERLMRWGLEAERIDAVDGRALVAAPPAARSAEQCEAPALSPGELGCLASHRLAIETGQRRGLNCVLVLEDDACLHRRFGERLAELAAIGDDWDLLYLGSSQYDRRAVRFVNAHCYRARKTLGTFAYAMRHTLFDKFLFQT